MTTTDAGSRRKPCSRCNGPKDLGRGNKYCSTCSELVKKEQYNKWLDQAREPCQKCGGEKRKGHGERYCDECHELVAWARKKRRMYRKPRMCKNCGVNKAAYNCLKCESCRLPKITCYYCDEEVRAPGKRLCQVHWIEAVQRAKDYRAAWATTRTVKYPKKKRELTKEERRAFNENRRFMYRLMHDSKPLSMAAYKRGAGNRVNPTKLPAAPLLPLIEKWLEENMVVFKGQVVKSEVKLIEQAGVGEKLIREMKNGMRPTIWIADADKLCHVLGTTLDLVYGIEAGVEPITDVEGDLCA